MERSELSVHKILIVGGKTHPILLLRSVLGIAGVSKILQTEDPRRAIELLSTEQFSAVFVGAEIGDIDGVTFPVTARRRDGVLNPMIPIFALKARAHRRDVERARDDGVTDVMTVPISPKTIMTKLNAAFEAPRPFIVSSEFFGPDRRARNRAAWYGSDRRKRAAKKAKVDFTAI
jgi:CheY-like chemotaxis protein